MPTALRLPISAVLALIWLATGVGTVWVLFAIGCAFLAPYRGVFYLLVLAFQQPTKWTATDTERGGGNVGLPPRPGTSRFD